MYQLSREREGGDRVIIDMSHVSFSRQDLVPKCILFPWLVSGKPVLYKHHSKVVCTLQLATLINTHNLVKMSN